MLKNPPSPAYDDRGLGRLGLFAFCLFFGWAIFSLYALHASLPSNSVHLPLAKSLHIAVFMPEEWNFFTADSRAENMLPFKRLNDGRWASVSLSPNLRAYNDFGLRRANRTQRIEIYMLLSTVPKDHFQDCTDLPVQCLDKLPSIASIDNSFPQPTICGDVAFAIQKPVPWAWRAMTNGTRDVIIPSRSVRMYVRCS